DSFRGDSAFYTWLYRIAVNTAKNYLVAQGRRPLKANGKRFDLRKGMFLDGKWVLPGEEINCKCGWEAVIPGLEKR
ncbi:hypothetical protein V5H41_25765, partial [Salmonella enterica]